MKNPTLPTPDERREAWLRTYDLKALWPESTPAQHVAAHREILTASRQILAGTPARLGASGPAEVHATGLAAFLGGVGALLGWWIEKGVLTAGEQLGALLQQHLSEGRARAARMQQRLSVVLGALGRQGIQPVLLKGNHTSRQYFDDPGVRPSGDLDLLVSSGERDAVASALKSLDLERGAGHAMPHREEWRPVSATPLVSLEMLAAENPWAVDVHYTLDRRYFAGLEAGLGTAGPDQLATWKSDDLSVRVLGQPLLTAYLAVHGSADFPDLQLMRAIELVRVLRSDAAGGGLSWPGLLELLRETGTRRFAWPAFAFAEWLAPGTVDAALLRELAAESTPRLRKTLPQAITIPPHHFEPRSLRMRLAWAKGPSQVALNIAEWLYPTGPEIDGRTRLRIWRRRLGLAVRGRFGWS